MKLTNGNYIRPAARFSWWLRQGNYFRYMMRELSSLFIGIFTIIMIWGLYQLSTGEAAYNAWTANLWSSFPLLSIVMLLFAIYHSYTWFMVTPKAMAIKIAGKRIAGGIIIAAHLLLWLFCSVAVWVLFIVGGE